MLSSPIVNNLDIFKAAVAHLGSGQVHPTLVSPQIEDFRGPDLIRRGGHELAIQQVASYRQIVFRIRRGLQAALVTRPDVVVVHRVSDALGCRTGQGTACRCSDPVAQSVGTNA